MDGPDGRVRVSFFQLLPHPFRFNLFAVLALTWLFTRSKDTLIGLMIEALARHVRLQVRGARARLGASWSALLLSAFR